MSLRLEPDNLNPGYIVHDGSAILSARPLDEVAAWLAPLFRWMAGGSTLDGRQHPARLLPGDATILHLSSCEVWAENWEGTFHVEARGDGTYAAVVDLGYLTANAVGSASTVSAHLGGGVTL